MYQAACPRWFGTYSDIRHIVVPSGTSEGKVIEAACDASNKITGSKSCDIKLLQMYHMLIQPKKSYAALTTLNFHGEPDSGTLSNTRALSNPRVASKTELKENVRRVDNSS